MYSSRVFSVSVDVCNTTTVCVREPHILQLTPPTAGRPVTDFLSPQGTLFWTCL